MKLNIFNTVDEVLNGLAQYFVDVANPAIEKQGSFTVALSGGSSPKKLYDLLASDAYRQQLDWSKVYFFFGDERYVPADSQDSNFRMVKEVLFDPLKINDANIFPVNTSLSPEAAATEYMNDITGFFNGKDPVFDLILLGLGDNSHTASLFPYTPVLHEQEATVRAVFLADQQVYRITLTAPLINKADAVAFLVYGETKAEAVYTILEKERDIEKFPAQLIQPVNGKLEWFLDQAAAANISLLPE